MAKRAERQPKPPRPKANPKNSGLVLSGVARVNLLPPSELRRRAARALIRRWVAGLAVTAIVVSGLVVAAYWQRGIAEQQLVDEQARTAQLNIELAGLSHVSQALARRATLTTLRTAAMGNDTEWQALFGDLARTVPSGAQLTGFELVTGANPVADGDPAAGIGVIGRLTVHTQDPADQNRMVDKLRGLDLILSADAGTLSSAGEEGFSFVVEFVADQTHYSHLTEGGSR